jgi:hypothetical protein
MIMLLIKEGADGCSERPRQDERGPEEKNALRRREDSLCFEIHLAFETFEFSS